MVLSEIKDQIEDLIKKFGGDAEVSFKKFEDDDDQNYDMNVRFDSADEEDGIVEVVVEYK